MLHGVVEHGFEIAEVYAASIGRGGGFLQELVEVLQPLQCNIVGLKRSGILFKFGIPLDNALPRCLVLFARGFSVMKFSKGIEKPFEVLGVVFGLWCLLRLRLNFFLLAGAGFLATCKFFHDIIANLCRVHVGGFTVIFESED